MGIKDKNVLVVSKTQDRSLQIRFENDLVKELHENGFNAIENHIRFPFSDPTEKVEKDKIKEVITQLCNHNIDVVIASHLVDSKKYTTLVTSEETIYLEPFPYRYRGYRSFYGYSGLYYTRYHTSKQEGVTYVLETLVYDLTLPDEKQLIYVITSEVANPSNLSVTSEDFSKSLVKNLLQ